MKRSWLAWLALPEVLRIAAFVFIVVGTLALVGWTVYVAMDLIAVIRRM